MPVIAPVRIASGEGSGMFENLSYRDGLNAARKLLILKALSRTQGNRSAAAKLLGLESKYLLKLMKSPERDQVDPFFLHVKCRVCLNPGHDQF